KSRDSVSSASSRCCGPANPSSTRAGAACAPPAEPCGAVISAWPRTASASKSTFHRSCWTTAPAACCTERHRRQALDEVMVIWAEWVKPSAGLPTVQWSLLLAVAAAAGHLLQRHTGLPKLVGYSLVGTIAGLAGFSGAAWPLQGVALFLLELGVAVVLFESGGRIALRWFRHNPMVLLQSLLE